MSQLPIKDVLSELFEAIENSNQVILKAPTGAGKSTYFPLQLLRHRRVDGKIIMLEPRRIAARNIAMYLAQQLSEPVGESVGYRVRGETKVSSHTRLEIVTEGVLTRMLQDDPELNGIGAIIFDEFHERSLHADTALAFTLEVQEALRDDLKLIVMSATLESHDLKRVLPQARYIESKGRSFPVEVMYRPMGVNENLPQAMCQQILSAMSHHSGSLLAFLPGVGAIKRTEALLMQSQSVSESQSLMQLQSLTQLQSGYDICPLYGQLDFKAQQRAIQPAASGQRKIVLATNIAETSLTIEGIRIVLDSGLENQATFDLKNGVTKLAQGRIAQSSAIQRSGRAGRLEPGVCIRLYSESQFNQQPQQSTPEILRSDLAPLMLELLKWGCQDVATLRWLDIPKATNVEQAKALLRQLQLLDASSQLTLLGQRAHTLGVEPRLASLLLQAQPLGAVELTTAIALCCLIEEPERGSTDLRYALHRWQTGQHTRSAALSLRAKSIAQKLKYRFILNESDESLLGVLAALGYPDRIAAKRSGNSGQFLLANGHGVQIADHDKLADEEYLVVLDVLNTGRGSSQIFKALAVDIPSIEHLAPQLVENKQRLEWDDKRGGLVASEVTQLGAIVLKQKMIPIPDDADISGALLANVRRHGLSVLNWTSSANEYVTRVECARGWLDVAQWPNMSQQALLADLELWLLPFMHGISSMKGLKALNIMPALEAYLGWEASNVLNDALPTHLVVPTGAKKKIRYQVGHAPMLSIKLQEMFGEKASPRIANGRQAIVLELLSPAQRPLQITQDLAAFWQGAYKDVQKEMKGRYPKHPWPDDPMNHQATHKTKRQLNS
ncbi:ATP-dependent helicase HrpB [Vibrio methylphosphonaticus]|uniref:ATP-dependent helicase HrpB n=1 Tax=Vibrio methylphosphonaticus TaxID=2946866 RepID=UPI00202A4C3D|nr:ATP-dependent helicase HrpB [Vibrio methylphosphonaticus]MCL9773416.1 ATP-dependent helicase HrpB [Vibrio methylphosphonaticus]